MPDLPDRPSPPDKRRVRASQGEGPERARRVQAAQADALALVDQAPLPIALRDLDGRLQLLNRLGCARAGRSTEEVVGRTSEDVWDPKTAAALEEHEERVRESREPCDFELTRVLPDGSVRELHVIRYPVFDEQDELIGVGGITLDITALKQAEQQLRMLGEITRNMAEGVVLVRTTDWTIAYANPEFERMFGYDPGELTDKPVQLINAPSERDPHVVAVEIQTQLALHGTWSGEVHNIKKDGTPFWCHVSVSNFEHHEHGIVSVAVHTDITERKRAEELAEQLRHYQKLDSIGRLAGGVAHDFNNMLTAIKGYGQLLLEGLAREDPLRSHAEQINRAAEQASLLPRQLLAFSRNQPAEASLIDINQVLTRASDMLARLLGDRITLTVSLRAQPACVLADPGHIEQVLVNLTLNAGQAMPDGGALRISTRRGDPRQEAPSEPAAQDGPHVVICVCDDGAGMDADTQSRLFEPFFTTKPNGSGLGLSTVYGIVSQCDGFIKVQSEPHAGSRFELWIPSARADAGPGPDELAQPAEHEPHRATVLLAEDEHVVRDFAVAVLERAGYRVHVAANGEDALAFCEASEEEIDALVTDVVMPGMGGYELAEHVRALRAQTPVVLISGYSEPARARDGEVGTQMCFLRKPFSPDMLEECVHEAIASQQELETPEQPADGDARRSGADAPAHPTGEKSADAITCLVADDHPAVLDSVSRFLEQSGVEVSAGVSRGDDALEQILALRPRVAILDARMSPMSGVEVARRASSEAPETHTVLYTGFGDQALLKQALDAGARGFVLKEAPISDLLRAVHAVAEGGTYVDAELARVLASGRFGERSPLTGREQQILALIADGLTNAQVASTLGISAETVQTHVRNAMTKLDADSRTQAVATAFRRSLLV